MWLCDELHNNIKEPQGDQCKYSATKLDNLKRHKESKHKDIRYICDKCEYASTTRGDLKRHKESQHEGTLVIYVNIPLHNWDTWSDTKKFI